MRAERTRPMAAHEEGILFHGTILFFVENVVLFVQIWFFCEFCWLFAICVLFKTDMIIMTYKIKRLIFLFSKKIIIKYYVISLFVKRTFSHYLVLLDFYSRNKVRCSIIVSQYNFCAKFPRYSSSVRSHFNVFKNSVGR